MAAHDMPVRIERDEQYDGIHGQFGQLFTNTLRTASEKRLMDVLGVLIQDYDRRNALPAEESAPTEILQFLVEQSGKSATELLSPVFGHRGLVSEALSGIRSVSTQRARKLGNYST